MSAELQREWNLRVEVLLDRGPVLGRTEATGDTTYDLALLPLRDEYLIVYSWQNGPHRTSQLTACDTRGEAVGRVANKLRTRVKQHPLTYLGNGEGGELDDLIWAAVSSSTLKSRQGSWQADPFYASTARAAGIKGLTYVTCVRAGAVSVEAMLMYEDGHPLEWAVAYSSSQ